MSKIIGISGKLGSGKDTIADLLVDRSPRWVKDSFARAVREELASLYTICATSDPATALSTIVETFDVEQAAAEQMYSIIVQDTQKDFSQMLKTVHYRTAMQVWATDIRRQQNPEYWVQQAFQHVASHHEKGHHVVFADVRFVNEAAAILEAGGSVFRLDVSPEAQAQRVIQRDGKPPHADSLLHASETSLDDFPNFTARYRTDDLTPQDILSRIVSQVEGS